ncbi:Uncharacterised protein [Mycobacteroides abscessus subsp. abscessus]|nr:Uncharacterised protein [Mycobacteroides abscessus subsp. abscessus]
MPAIQSHSHGGAGSPATPSAPRYQYARAASTTPMASPAMTGINRDLRYTA